MDLKHTGTVCTAEGSITTGKREQSVNWARES